MLRPRPQTQSSKIASKILPERYFSDFEQGLAGHLIVLPCDNTTRLSRHDLPLLATAASAPRHGSSLVSAPRRMTYGILPGPRRPCRRHAVAGVRLRAEVTPGNGTNGRCASVFRPTSGWKRLATRCMPLIPPPQSAGADF